MEAEILQRLYDSEINFLISCFYDDGFLVMLGDHMNGYEKKKFVMTFFDAVDWLAKTAVIHYPTSEFAKWWNNLNLNKQEK